MLTSRRNGKNVSERRCERNEHKNFFGTYEHEDFFYVESQKVIR